MGWLETNNVMTTTQYRLMVALTQDVPLSLDLNAQQLILQSVKSSVGMDTE